MTPFTDQEAVIQWLRDNGIRMKYHSMAPASDDLGGCWAFPSNDLLYLLKALRCLAEEAAVEEYREALEYLLAQTVDQDLKHGIALSEGEEDARQKSLALLGREAA